MIQESKENAWLKRQGYIGVRSGGMEAHELENFGAVVMRRADRSPRYGESLETNMHFGMLTGS